MLEKRQRRDQSVRGIPEGFADDAGYDPGIAAIDEAEIVNRVEIVQRRLVAAHQRRLLADCRRPQPRADAHRVRAGVERDAEHRRLGIGEIPGLRRSHESVHRREDRLVEDARHRLLLRDGRGAGRPLEGRVSKTRFLSQYAEGRPEPSRRRVVYGLLVPPASAFLDCC